MTTRQYRNYSYLSFFFSIVFSGFLIKTIIAEQGLKKLIFSLLFGVLVVMTMRLGLLMRRKLRESDLE